MRNINNVSNTMICRLRDIGNMNTLHSLERIQQVVNVICNHNKLNILNEIKTSHKDFEYSLMYVLDDCHFSVKTFPEKSSLIFHIIFYKNYDHNDCLQIYDFLCQAFNADMLLSTVEFDDITTV